MTNRSDRIKAHLNAKKLNEDAAGDVLRASVARGKLKAMEGKKKSPALIAKLTARVAAGKRYQTEEAIKKAVKPAPKPVKILTNNPGYGYHGIADAKHKGDTNKAHAEYNRMHAKVKDWAGEAGHLMHAKKPNLMVRDYLDSSRGRHLEGLQADEKYIKKDFGHFARSYDPKLFVESLNEAATHGVFCVWHSGDRKGMVIHHGGNTSDPAKAEKLAAKLNTNDVEAFNKRSAEKSNYHYEARPLRNKKLFVEEVENLDELSKNTLMSYKSKSLSRVDNMAKALRGKEHKAVDPLKMYNKVSGIKLAQRKLKEQAGDPGDDDHSGVYEVQQRDGRYKNVRIKRQPDGKYHIHHADGSKGSTDLNGVKSYISRNNAAWMKEEHSVNEAKSAYAREYDAYKKERNVKTYDEFTKRAHDFAKQRSKQKVDFEPRDNTTVSWAKPKGSPHKIMLGIFSHSVDDHNKGTGHHVLPKHKVVAPGDFSGRDLFEETLDEAAKKNLIRSLVDSSIDSKSAATKK